MRIRDVMHSPAQTCSATTTLEDAARHMWVDEVGTLIVVDEAGSPVGVVTDRDLAVHGYARGLPGDCELREVMSHAVVTIGADEDVFDAVALMAGRGVRRLPVMDGVAVVGVIALDDLMQLIGREAAELGRAVAAQADARHYAGWADWDAL